MKKMPDVLYAVSELTNTDRLIKPHFYSVVSRQKKCFRIPLAETVEDAILFTYPNLHYSNFTRLKFRVFVIQPCKRHGILKPKSLQHRHNFPYAEELKEYASLKNLRMEFSHTVCIRKSDKANEEVYVSRDDKEILLGVRYLPMATV